MHGVSTQFKLVSIKVSSERSRKPPITKCRRLSFSELVVESVKIEARGACLGAVASGQVHRGLREGRVVAVKRVASDKER